MRCPFCAGEDSQVKDSRPSEDGAAIRRRRQCEACGARFTTFERVQLRDLIVVKSVVMLLVFAVILVNFLVDMSYILVDPRLRKR